MSNYQLLANAIVNQAADDYVQRLTGIGGGVLPPDCTVEEIERFFRSRWFGILCGLDPDYLLRKLQEKVKRMSSLQYTVSKEKGSRRYYAHKTGEPHKPVPGSFGTKKDALHIAADLQGLTYGTYMQVRRKERASVDSD